MGRPSKYNSLIARQICERISTSSDGLRAICQEAAITTTTLYRWMEREEFRVRYARAREMQCQVLADEIIAIADTPQEGTVTRVSDKGSETRTGDMIEHRRLQIDARKWVLSKLVPSKYGDKQSVEHTGPEGGPISHTIRFADGPKQ